MTMCLQWSPRPFRIPCYGLAPWYLSSPIIALLCIPTGHVAPRQTSQCASHQSVCTFCPNGQPMLSPRCTQSSGLRLLMFDLCSYVLISERFVLITIFKNRNPNCDPLSSFKLCISLLNFHYSLLTAHPCEEGSFMTVRIFTFILCSAILGT